MKMAFVMDPIESADPQRDTTVALMLEARSRSHEVFHIKPESLFARAGEAFCKTAEIEIYPPDSDAKSMEGLYSLGKHETRPLSEMETVWMRKDPPFNMDYIYLTHILELAERGGTVVVNRPEAIRNSNEKLAAIEFRRFMPDTLVSKDGGEIGRFLSEKGKIVIKPLDGFGGEGIVKVEKGEKNAARKIDGATGGNSVFVMAQEFIENVSEGDKRVIMLGGKPVGAVLRIPAEGGFICNFHSGGRPVKTELNKRDEEICSALGPRLLKRGIYFAGIDIVGGMLTEINCTSPTCVREINRFEGTKLEAEIMDFAETLCEKARRENP